MSAGEDYGSVSVCAVLLRVGGPHFSGSLLTLLVARLQLLDGSLDVLHAALLTHLVGGEVGVQASTVPVTGHGLGVHRDAGAKDLGDTVEKETGDPKFVTHCNTLARADLELPLGGHNLGIGAGNVNASVQACLVVRLNDISLDDLAGTDTAVVRALGSRETVGGLSKEKFNQHGPSLSR